MTAESVHPAVKWSAAIGAVAAIVTGVTVLNTLVANVQANTLAIETNKTGNDKAITELSTTTKTLATAVNELNVEVKILQVQRLQGSAGE